MTGRQQALYYSIRFMRDTILSCFRGHERSTEAAGGEERPLRKLPDEAGELEMSFLSIPRLGGMVMKTQPQEMVQFEDVRFQDIACKLNIMILLM